MILLDAYRLRPLGNPGNLLYLFTALWLLVIAMKMFRPLEFAESIRRPFIYYRMYTGRASRHFDDFRVLSFLAIELLTVIIIAWYKNAFSLRQLGIIALAVTAFYAANFLGAVIASAIDRRFLYLHFLKWIFAHYATYYGSFWVFGIIFLPVPGRWKHLMLAVVIGYFYLKYLYYLVKINRELRIRPLFIILYLCTTEWIPAGVLIYSLSRFI
ncbi:MAG: hypothetical protein GXO27_01365 [Chlorobi bacterium]|nr:hypothetical protein [Chlorobiota bacterium]